MVCLQDSMAPAASSGGQGHKVVTILVMWKFLTQGICTSNINTVLFIDQKLQAWLKSTDKPMLSNIQEKIWTDIQTENVKQYAPNHSISAYKS